MFIVSTLRITSIYFGHIVRRQGNCLDMVILQGKIEGTRRRGRPRRRWIDMVKSLVGQSCILQLQPETGGGPSRGPLPLLKRTQTQFGELAHGSVQCHLNVQKSKLLITIVGN